MTKAEALKRAKELLGESAVVQPPFPYMTPRTYYVFPEEGASTLYAGIGKSWADAVANAEYKQNVRLGVWRA